MKTAYVILPGVQQPGESFRWYTSPTILSQTGLWEAMRQVPTGLVMRVRTDQNAGDRLSDKDRVESVIGLIDSTSRWRACLELITMALSSLRLPETGEACWAVFGLMTGKHPATVTMQERQVLANRLRGVIEQLPQDDLRAVYEGQVCAMCLRLAFAENDVEVAHIVPYTTIWLVNGQDYPEEREATVEVLAAAVLLTKAASRLAEKLPEWGYARLPALPGVPLKTPAAAPQEPLEADPEDRED